MCGDQWRGKEKKMEEIYYGTMKSQRSKQNNEGWGSKIKLVLNRAFQVSSNTSDAQFRNSSFIFCQWLKVGRWDIRNPGQYTEVKNL